MGTSNFVKKVIHPGISVAISKYTGKKTFIVRIRLPDRVFHRTYKTYGEAIQARYEILSQRPPVQPHRKSKKVLQPIRHEQLKRRLRKERWRYEKASARNGAGKRQEHPAR